MSKTPSNKLFNLVKSLTGSEKRYFKLAAKNNVGDKVNKYLVLFDAIDSQKAYNETVLKELVYKNEAIESRKYSELKAYLYEMILKSLQHFDEKSSVDYRLKGMLQSIRVLFKRSHYEECKEILQKAKKLAYKYESYVSILETLRWEKQIAYAQIDVAFLDRELHRIDEEEKECLHHLRNLSDYKNIFFEMLILIKKDHLVRSENQIKNLQSIINNPLLKNIDNALSHQAQILFYRIWGIYQHSTQNFNQYHTVCLQTIELMESKPYLLKEDVSEYIAMLSNYTMSCGLLRNYDAVNTCLVKFKSIRPNTLDDEVKIHRHYYTHKFFLCIYTGEFEEGLEELERHLKASKKFDKQFFESNSFYFQYFYIAFGAGDYERALEYLNHWLDLSNNIERKDLQSIARILNLITHYEMGNNLLLESLLRSTYRYQKKQGHIFKFEKKMVTFIGQLIKISNRPEKRNAFTELKKDFEQLSNDPVEKIMFRYFDVIAWMESKITERPFATVVKERYLGKSAITVSQR